MRLSILDQTPVLAGQSPAQALQVTLTLAGRADALGYHRYWLAEHHGMGALADPCPEILATRVAGLTQRLRVGTGGVLLPYYSPLKVAEVFRMLEALFPGRVDLGIGRAPGGNLAVAQAINPDAFFGEDTFPAQVTDTVGYLDNRLPPQHPFRNVRAMPAGPGAPEVWLLGSSDYSGALAADLGLRFAYAHFISPQGAAAVLRDYRQSYRPSYRETQPVAMLAVFALCAPTEEEARALAAPMDLRRVQLARGQDLPIVSTEQALAWPLEPEDRALMERERSRSLVGTPASVRQQIEALALRCSADEVMVLTITGDTPSRLRSYELLAQEFALPAIR